MIGERKEHGQLKVSGGGLEVTICQACALTVTNPATSGENAHIRRYIGRETATVGCSRGTVDEVSQDPLGTRTYRDNRPKIWHTRQDARAKLRTGFYRKEATAGKRIGVKKTNDTIII